MQTVLKKSITVQTALTALNAAIAKAISINLKISVAIMDESGRIKGLLRMDGASLASLQAAQDKAYSACNTGVATHLWHDIIKNDPPLLIGLPLTPGIVVFGGGIPIYDEKDLVGSIGVSGGHYTQDMECARAALEAIGAPQP